jgi:hypothetical protein
VREIADHFGYRSSTAARSLRAGLEARGHIKRIARQDRAIEIVSQSVESPFIISTSRPNR